METGVRIVKNATNGFRLAELQKTAVKILKFDAEIMQTVTKRAYKVENGVKTRKTAFRLLNKRKTGR